MYNTPMKPFQFLKEVGQQFKHISWPDSKTVTRLSFVVITVSILSSLFLGAFDVIFAKAFAEISKTSQPPIQTEDFIEDLQVDPLATPSAETDISTPSSETNN